MKKPESTLKIKNITFSRQSTLNLQSQTIRTPLRNGKANNQYFLSSSNKQNSSAKKQEKIQHEAFKIHTIHQNKSCFLLFQKKQLNEVMNRYQSHSRLINLNDSKNNLLERKSSHRDFVDCKELKNHTQPPKRGVSQSAHRRSLKTAIYKPIEPAIVQRKKLVINANDKIFSVKISNYFQFLENSAKLHKIQIKFQDYKQNPTIFVGGGNNSKLVKDIIKKRWWLKIKDKKASQPLNIPEINFMWTQIKVLDYYSQINMPEKIIHNHFECNGQLGNKKQLFINLKKFYENQNKNPFQVIPLTFHLKNSQGPQFQEFRSQYQAEKQKHPSKSQLWIVKPGQNSNRGQGITIHSELQEIKKLIIEEQNHQKSQGSSSKSSTFIVQKYIEKPFLYQKRKFDIRCYYLLVCLNNKIKAYWYKQGYIRTSCFQFNCNAQSKENIFVHLTNDAVQKNNQNYGKFEDGNKIDFSTFKKYLAAKHPNQKYDFDAQIWSKIKQIGIDTIKATYQKLRKSDKPVFQIFGLDFMIDEEFKPWLIEVNTNPCLETTCLVLERIIPKMVDQAFQLSVDLVFPPPENWASSKKYLVPTNLRAGFELIFDQQEQNNSFQKISNLRKQ